MANPQKVLEYIAKTTETPIGEAKKSLNIEYWKDMVGFLGQSGAQMLIKYLGHENVTKVKPLCGGLGIEVPSSIVHEEPNTRGNIKFYCSKMDSGWLTRLNPNLRITS